MRKFYIGGCGSGSISRFDGCGSGDVPYRGRSRSGSHMGGIGDMAHASVCFVGLCFPTHALPGIFGEVLDICP